MNWFKKTMLIGAISASALFGCEANHSGAGSSSSGSLSISKDNAFLYAADTDNGILAVVDVKSKTKVAEIKVGKDPVRVLVGADETIYVANRGDRSVSVITKGNWVEAKRLAVGIEPSGLALTADGKTLLVTSTTSKNKVEVGTLTGFDTASLEQKFEIEVGEEPRAVTVLNNNRALVSFFKRADVAEVDLNNVKVTKSGTDLQKLVNASRGTSGSSGSTFGGTSTFAPHGMTDLIATPDGNRVFAPVMWSREDAILGRPSVSAPYYRAGGPCNVGSVATSGIVTIETQGSPTPKVDDLTACSGGAVVSGNQDFPVTTLATRDTTGANTIQGPTVGVVDPTGSWLFVVNRESSNVAVLPTYRRSGSDLDFERSGSSVRNTVHIGAGADGIALSNDGLQAYVYSQFDHKIELLESSGAGNQAHLVNKGVINVVAKDTLSPEMAEGRRLFFDAMDTRMSSSSINTACSSCHLDGRDDGHVWQFPDGARQTPVLAGRKLLSTGPWHWSGEFATLEKFSVHTITERMGGSGLSEPSTKMLNSYIDSLPNSDNAIRTGMSADVAVRGRQAFEKANCNSCHAGALLTDNRNADVGTLRLGKVKNPDNGVVVQTGFNVPSLIGVGRSAPYLHDGSQATLEERIFANNTQHGNAAALSDVEKAELVTYLKSL
jgi:YVTN family beta-propeller protein